MQDLTIILPTLNLVPKEWQAFHKKTLLEAIDGAPIITISKNPMDWGNNVLEDGPPTVENLYWKILRGAKLAKTPFIAIAEDDALYTREHFLFRPSMDVFAYNMHRWAIFTWGQPFYFLKQSIANTFLIAPRELTIEALTERFTKYPLGSPPKFIPGELGREKNERSVGLTPRKHVEFITVDPQVQFYHEFGFDPLEKSRRKKPWPIRAYDIPRWGRAEELRKFFC